VINGRCVKDVIANATAGKRVRGCGERAVVLAMVIVIAVVLAVSGLALYAMHRSKPSRLKLAASLLTLASFSIEVESQEGRRGGELPPDKGLGR